MSKGFQDNNVKVTLNKDEVIKLIKNYKDIKKYMKSSYYALKKMDGSEKIVSKLLEET